MGDG
jgi:hypothetical protein